MLRKHQYSSLQCCCSIDIKVFVQKYRDIWFCPYRPALGGCVVLSLSGGIDVFGLGQAGQLILVARQAAEEDGTADADDGGAPAKAVSPGVVIVALEDQLVELDGVDD